MSLRICPRPPDQEKSLGIIKICVKFSFPKRQKRPKFGRLLLIIFVQFFFNEHPLTKKKKKKENRVLQL